MSLASQGMLLPFPPLDHLEGQGGRTLVGGGFEDRLLHPLLITTSLQFRSLFPAILSLPSRGKLGIGVFRLSKRELSSLLPPLRVTTAIFL